MSYPYFQIIFLVICNIIRLEKKYIFVIYIKYLFFFFYLKKLEWENFQNKINASLWWYNQTSGFQPERGCNTSSPSDELRQRTNTCRRQGTPAICNYKIATSPSIRFHSTQRPLFQTLKFTTQPFQFNPPSKFPPICKFNLEVENTRKKYWPDFPPLRMISMTRSYALM